MTQCGMLFTTPFVSHESSHNESREVSFLRGHHGVWRADRHRGRHPLDVVEGHALIDVVVADPTCRKFVERAARNDVVYSTYAKTEEGSTLPRPQKWDEICAVCSGDVQCVVFRLDCLLAEIASLASRRCAWSSHIISTLCTCSSRSVFCIVAVVSTIYSS